MRRFLSLFAVAALLVSCEKSDPVVDPGDSGQPGEPVVLKEGDVAVSSVTINGKMAVYDAGTATFLATMPTVTDFSSMDVAFMTAAKEIVAGEQVLSTRNTGIDLRKPLAVRFILNGVYRDCFVAVRNTGLPVVRIDTPGGQKISSKTTWMEGARMRIELADGTVQYEGTTEIRGRGNSTWNYPKKPYALRLSEKAEILGMPKHKRWILLANWKDRTLMRNDAAFWLSSHSGLPYTVRGQFVELVLNGAIQGNYYLCEQIKLSKNRVAIEEMDPMETDPEKITGGWLLEVDTYYDEKYKFKYDRLFNIPWMVKEPDEDELSGVAFQYIQGWIRDLETLLKDPAKVQAHAYEEFLDVDTAIDYLIVEELTGNNDFYNYWPWAGGHSLYLYKERGGKLYHGPVWDFDYHVFCPQFVNQWVGATKTLFYPALLKDPKFRTRLQERWAAQKDELKKLPGYIDAQADYIRLSEEYNHAQWPIVNNPENGDEEMAFQQAIDRIKKAFLDKWEWMDRNIGNLRM